MQAIKYTMAGGKRIRGLTAAQTYEAFVGPEKLTEENIKLAAILGIAMEMVNENSFTFFTKG